MRFGEFATRAAELTGAGIRNAVDGTIELTFPGWAVRRLVARSRSKIIREMRHITGTLGQGGAINNQLQRLARRRTLSAEEDTRRFRPDMLSTARDLYARNPWAVGAVNSITGNVIGKGMSLESNIRFQGGENVGTADRRSNERVEDVWKRWAKGADITGKKSFLKLQRIAYRERWVANDVFIRRHFDPEKEVPLSLEVVGAELVNSDAPGSKQGINFDARGRITGYNFFRSATDRTSEVVDEENVIHFFNPHRPGAIRGLSPMSPVARTFDALDVYLNHELTRAGVASAFVLLHKTGGKGFVPGLKDGEGTEQDEEGNPVVNISEGGGIMLTGAKDDALDFASPAIQSTAFEPFVRLVLRAIATAMGISYELLARDFTKTNFSSSRSAHLEDRRQWEPEQAEFINEVLDRVWEWFIDAAVIARIQPFSSQRQEFPVIWIPQGWLWVDPLKEASATGAAIAMGLDNPFDAARRLGRDLRDNLRKKAEAEELAAELGTTIDTSGGQQSGGGTEDGDDPNKTEEDGDGEEGEEGEEGDGRGPRRYVA